MTTLIGLGGLKTSGKDVFADALQDHAVDIASAMVVGS